MRTEKLVKYRSCYDSPDKSRVSSIFQHVDTALAPHAFAMVCSESHLARLPASLREGRVLEWGCMRLLVIHSFLNNLPLV